MSHYVPIETGIKAYHVGTDQEYKSFTQLIWDLREDQSEKIIYVHGGTYDIFREYRESTIPRPPREMESVHCYRPYNAIVSKNSHIIGIGRVRFVYAPSAEETYLTESKVISLLNLADSATIENIELIGYNCRYLIHDETLGLPEFDGAQKRIITEFNNCYFKGNIGAIDENNETRGERKNAYDIRVKNCGEVQVIIHDLENRFAARVYK